MGSICVKKQSEEEIISTKENESRNNFVNSKSANEIKTIEIVISKNEKLREHLFDFSYLINDNSLILEFQYAFCEENFDEGLLIERFQLLNEKEKKDIYNYFNLFPSANFKRITQTGDSDTKRIQLIVLSWLQKFKWSEDEKVILIPLEIKEDLGPLGTVEKYHRELLEQVKDKKINHNLSPFEIPEGLTEVQKYLSINASYVFDCLKCLEHVDNNDFSEFLPKFLELLPEEKKVLFTFIQITSIKIEHRAVYNAEWPEEKRDAKIGEMIKLLIEKMKESMN